MQQLIYFLQRYKFGLYFLLLLLISLALTISNHSFHRSKFVSSTNSITGGIYEKANSIDSYMNLKSENELLIEENLLLKNKLNKYKSLLDTVHQQNIVDTLYQQKYELISGSIIKNQFHSSYNYLTINRGEKNDIKTEMGVINHKGIIGITDNSSANYARVQSILNRNSKINARFKNSTHFGTLTWDTKSYNIVQLVDLPKQAVYSVGDTIITGGRSAIFPEGIPVGTVLQKNTSTSIDVELFNDMSNVRNVYLIKNYHKEEIKNIENPTNE